MRPIDTVFPTTMATPARMLRREWRMNPGSIRVSSSITATVSNRVSTSKWANARAIAAGFPTFSSSSRTSAPAVRATFAVASVLPSETTNTGACARACDTAVPICP